MNGQDETSGEMKGQKTNERMVMWRNLRLEYTEKEDDETADNGKAKGKEG